MAERVAHNLNKKSTLSNLIDIHTHSGWKARLLLRFIDRGDKTVLKERKQQGPLAIQRPFYPERSTCHCYLLHPPGGVVGGDSLGIQCDVAQGAKVLLTTPGATKFYRSESKYAFQEQLIYVDSDSSLEWLPQENIFFPDAYVRLNTKVYLRQNAQFFGWEMHFFGCFAPNVSFEQGHLIGKTEIYLEGNPILSEAINLSGKNKIMKIKGLLNFTMMGTLYISIDDENFYQLVQSLLFKLQQEFGHGSLIIAVSQLEGLMVVRALSDWSELMLDAFEQVRKLSRTYWTGVAPCSPRIWAT